MGFVKRINKNMGITYVWQKMNVLRKGDSIVNYTVYGKTKTEKRK